jgi:Holliday junction DNA helicase RuvB
MAKTKPPVPAPAGDVPESLLHGELIGEEDPRDHSLRPRTLREFLGQRAMKENLEVFIRAAKARQENLDHLFLIGPPGLGKTTLAQVIARELETEIIQTSAPALEKPKDLVGILTNLKERNVFFIDEIHRLKPAIEEMLYVAMEDYEMDWIIGQGPGARTLRIPIKPFTLIGATTKAGNVASPLVSRFGIPCRFSFYEQADMEAIVRRSAGILETRLEDNAAALLAASARGTPRVANRLLRRIRDFAQVMNAPSIAREVVEEGLRRLEIDRLGLEKQDRDILAMIIRRYNGGPVGAETLAISMGEGVDTLEDYYEPYLIQTGLIQRTPRGRVATALAYEHLGLPRDAHENSGLLF